MICAAGGPKQDIVIPALNEERFWRPRRSGEPVGLRATTVEEYAECIVQVLTMDEAQRMRIAAAARFHVQRFSNERFRTDVLCALQPILQACSAR